MTIFSGESFVTFVNPFYYKIQKSSNIQKTLLFFKRKFLVQSSCFDYDICVLL